MNEGEAENKWIDVKCSVGSMSVHHSMQKNQDMQEIQAKFLSQVMSNTLTFIYHGSCQRNSTFKRIFKGSKKPKQEYFVWLNWDFWKMLSENELNEQAAKMFCSF